MLLKVSPNIPENFPVLIFKRYHRKGYLRIGTCDRFFLKSKGYHQKGGSQLLYYLVAVKRCQPGGFAAHRVCQEELFYSFVPSRGGNRYSMDCQADR
jgi:hypothetical protein